ncbi:MAG: DUF5320 domain-containing protein [Bacilli bacterium]
MPGRNQTGPQGMGPRTGRGFGICESGQTVDYQSTPRQGMRQGCGRGMGRGGGRCCGYRGVAYPISRIEESSAENQKSENQSQKK